MHADKLHILKSYSEHQQMSYDRPKNTLLPYIL